MVTQDVQTVSGVLPLGLWRTGFQAVSAPQGVHYIEYVIYMNILNIIEIFILSY